MIIQRRIPLSLVLVFGLRLAVMGGVWAGVIFAVYAYGDVTLVRVPFLPIATVGTAVAFYIGFKNNSAYERFWEGRKIWGGIVNASRTWATAVASYVDFGDDGEVAQATRKRLVYRQLAWINALRLQLRRSSRFFDNPARSTKRRLDRDAEHMRNDWDLEISPFLSPEEHVAMKVKQNPATHLLHKQGGEVAALYREKRIEVFHQIAMMDVVKTLYDLQGMCERIKNTPFPRQYAEYSRVFTRVFVWLVPFGLLDVFAEQIDAATTAAETLLPIIPMILSASLITWVFVTMETLGDASEDPFERSMNDVPMNALCRTIEIDLRELLGEKHLPEKEKPSGPILY